LKRPDAKAASRSHRRGGFAWILRQLGASEIQLDRLVDGDLGAVVAELTRSARAGDPTSINILGFIAYQRCYLARSNDVLDQYEKSQISNARTLPAGDAEWMDTALRDDIEFDKRVNSICQQMINIDQALEWVSSLAKQGDAASLWLLSRTANNIRDEQQSLLDSAIAGFPQAQSDLAFRKLAEPKGAAGPDADPLSVGDLLRGSAGQIPRSEAQLAECEYWGCGGVEVDIPSAVNHAREAAERGSVEAIIEIGPRLQASEIDANEVFAWKAVGAALQQHGCNIDNFNVRSMQSTSAVRPSNLRAQELAERYWKQYGSQIMANLGCG
jgi:hypothetical protein